ncbi:MAG: site-specific DNA-methyltransferase, partial [Candidatus Gracilibacteria bacterium]
MDKKRQQKIYELLKRGLKLAETGEELPAEWARELFPPERREYELYYYGKNPEEKILADTMAVPLQEVSTFGPSDINWYNKLIFGDNLQAMKTLLQMKVEGKLINSDGTPGVRLIYIDPPFSTKRDFKGSQDQKAYQDKIAGAEFLEFLRERLIISRELLSEGGTIYVHLDWKKMHYMKVLLDEIFGENNFLNNVVWCYKTRQFSKKYWNRKHDDILVYKKGTLPNIFHWKDVLENYSEETIKKYKLKDEYGYYRLCGRGIAGSPIKSAKDVDPKWEKTHPELVVRNYLGEGFAPPDNWNIDIVNQSAIERINYPTQKPEVLLEKIIKASSSEGDIVLDAFAGSGTTAAVAEKLKRRWISIDCGKFAIYTIQKRILTLRKNIGNTGDVLQPKPFALCNAGLYDFENLRNLPWEDWRFFALKLFECKDESHKIHGFQMDGKRQGSSVHVFNHFKEGQISPQTIADLHASIGKAVGDRCFIIAPRGAFLFQEDYIETDGVRYYALRIPYSFINELHRN